MSPGHRRSWARLARDAWARVRAVGDAVAAGRGEWAWAPLVYVAVVAWTYRDLWHEHGVATGLGWDVIDTHGPDLDFLTRALRAGELPAWNPWDKGGYAVYADPVVCRYYPVAWLFAAAQAALGPSWWWIQLEVLAHHVLAGALLHLFLRRRGLPVPAALIGGIGLVCSAPLLVHKASSILWPLVWVPLVWVALDAALARPSARRGAAVAAALLPCATAGSPPGLFYAGLLIAPYAAWRAIAALRAGGSWRALVGCAAVAAGLTGLVLAVTVLPTQTLVAYGSRDRWATGDAFALSLSFAWPSVLRGVIAHAAGAPEMYVGAAVLVLAACALTRPRADGGAPVALVAIAAFALVLVAGATLPVLPWLVHHVPGFALLRVPGRYKLVAAWALAAAAGYGAAGLAGPAPARRVLGVVGAVVVATVAVVALSPRLPGRPPTWSIVAIAVPAALIALTRLARLAPRLRAGAPWALAAVVLVDAPLFTHRPDAPRAAEPRQRHDRDDAVLARLDGVRDRFRLYDEFVLGERVGQRRAIRELRGYPALDPLTAHRLVDVLERARRVPAIVTDLNVRWVLQGPHFRYATTASFLPPLAGDPAFTARGDGLYEARHPAPLVAWYGAAALVRPASSSACAVFPPTSPSASRRRGSMRCWCRAPMAGSNPIR